MPWWLFFVILAETACLYTWLWATAPIILFAHVGIAIPLALLAVKCESAEVKAQRASTPWSERIRTFPLWCIVAARYLAVFAALVIVVVSFRLMVH